jgi:hypothetical protein
MKEGHRRTLAAELKTETGQNREKGRGKGKKILYF